MLERRRRGHMNLVCTQLDRLAILVTGPDAGTYLHSQLSNDISSMGPSDSKYSFVLEPTGRVTALVRVTKLDTETFLLDTDLVAGLADALIARLERFKIRVRVDLTVSPHAFVAVRSTDDSPLSGSTLETLRTSPRMIVLNAWWGEDAIDVLILDGPEDVVSVSTMTGGRVGESGELEDLRVRAGWPSMGREIHSGESVPAATGVVSRVVSFSKGCYPGQELVERMDARGSTAPRTLRRLSRCEADPLTRGTSLFIDGEEVGAITSVSDNWVLALVVRSRELGDDVTLRG